MPKTLVFLMIGLFFGTGLGFLFAATSGAALDGHTHEPTNSAVNEPADHDHSAMSHDHSQLINTSGPVPTVALVFHPDGPQSRNMEIRLENFAFDPVAVNGKHVEGYGHAHVYVNDTKLARVYGPWVHLEALPPGTHEVRVTLNSNNHSQLAVNGQPIEATATLVIE